jgi:oligopeptide/dipeptide ABC transporter ATP-binding protein
MSQVQLKDIPLLQVRDVSVFYGKRVKAVDGVSFEIKELEANCLVGESGSGKTTLARCITLLTRPTLGSIKFQGEEITKFKGKDLMDYRRQVQLIFQDPYETLNPRQDVFTFVSTPIQQLLGERNRSVLYDRVAHLLEVVGLNPEITIGKLPHQLSGGERQRINIARALAPEPKLIVADEPVTMLDATQRLKILVLLTKIKSQKKLTLLMVTHDIASAKVISDRIMVMYGGKLVETGQISEALKNPSHPYLELLISSVPRLHLENRVKNEKSRTFVSDEQKVERGCVFRNRCKYARELCAQTEPKLSPTSSSTHFAACHYPLDASINAPRPLTSS